jgi:hypothetical protein
MIDAEQIAYHELCAYTLTHGDPRFIHQHVVETHSPRNMRALRANRSALRSRSSASACTSRRA